MGVSNEVCREILDTRDVLKQQITNALVENLLANTDLKDDQCKKLSSTLGSHVDNQLDGLIDRVAKKLESAT